MLVPFLIMLREGIEAALIVGIVASYLRVTGRSAWMPAVWCGIILAVGLSFSVFVALHVASAAIDRLHTTAESHNRILVCEVMGRHAGWIALHAGVAGGADVILIPEQPFDIEEVCARLRRRHDKGFLFSIVVVAEGALPQEGTMATLEERTDEFGHVRLGGIGQLVEREIEQRTGYETRTTVLGHIQRGGTPTAFDRWLATRFGLQAIGAVHDGDFGTMMALKGTDIVRVPLSEGTSELKLVSPEEYAEAEVFFG